MTKFLAFHGIVTKNPLLALKKCTPGLFCNFKCKQLLNILIIIKLKSVKKRQFLTNLYFSSNGNKIASDLFLKYPAVSHQCPNGLPIIQSRRPTDLRLQQSTALFIDQYQPHSLVCLPYDLVTFPIYILQLCMVRPDTTNHPNKPPLILHTHRFRPLKRHEN